MASPLMFYTNPMSRGRIVRWMLEETGAAYDTKILEYGTTMKEPAYLAINPMGKVPAIAHEGAVITECAAICAYLADAFPEAGLAPAPAARADYYRWLFYFAGPVEQASVNNSLGVRIAPEQEGRVGYGTLDRVIDVIEAAVTGKRFIAGERFSAADVYCGAQINWGMRFGWLPQRPALVAYRDGLVARPAFQRAEAKDNALAGN
jgi:glutathione S-transferase